MSFSCLNVFVLIRVKITDGAGLIITDYTKLIILLVDQKISYSNLNECTENLTDTKIKIISFGHNLPNDFPGAHTYVVTNLNSVIQTVMNYYK